MLVRSQRSFLRGVREGLAHGNFPLDSPVLTVVTFRNSSSVDWAS